jgi:phosphoglycolate phosphatase
VIFDFDLTLADSREAVTDCVSHALRELGLPAVEPIVIHRTVGLSLVRTFESLTGTPGHPLTGRFTELFVARADEIMVARTSLYPDAHAVLAELRARELRTAVVSTKFRHRIEGILAREGLANQFDVIIGGEDVARHKPDPEGLLLAVAELALPKSLALYVGDHPVDAEAAERADIRFAAVLSGPSTRADFARLAVARFLESLAELPAALTELSAAS